MYTKVAYYYDWIKKYVNIYQATECILPEYPENGRYDVDSDRLKKPGDSVLSYEWLTVKCNEGYIPKMSKVNCSTLRTLKCQGKRYNSDFWVLLFFSKNLTYLY